MITVRRIHYDIKAHVRLASEPTTMGAFKMLANEQLHHILSMLDIKSAVRLSITGRAMIECMNDDTLWRTPVSATLRFTKSGDVGRHHLGTAL
jgi:hypothetical protein